MTTYIHCEYCKDIGDSYLVELGSPCIKKDKIHTYDKRMGSGYPYYDQILNMKITGRGHKNKVMKEQSLIERG